MDAAKEVTKHPLATATVGFFLRLGREVAVITEFLETCVMGMRQRSAGPAPSGMQRLPLSPSSGEIYESAKTGEGRICASQSAVEAGANDGDQRLTTKGQTLVPQAARLLMHLSFLI